jgi:hypothetical protein
MNTLNLSEISKEITYVISGDLINGSIIEKETICRRIKYVNYEKNYLVCECDRRFIINDNLKIETFN